jgi:hypothetical protein
MYFLRPATALAVVAVGASRYNICPDVLPAQVTRRHVIHGQAALALSAVLAGIIIATKDLATCQFDVWTRPMNLVLQPDD